MHVADVDLINTDNLAGAEEFLRGQPQTKDGQTR